eukprot:1585156-Alexandrium_andersonii.AAC.1
MKSLSRRMLAVAKEQAVTLQAARALSTAEEEEPTEEEEEQKEGAQAEPSGRQVTLRSCGLWIAADCGLQRIADCGGLRSAECGLQRIVDC